MPRLGTGLLILALQVRQGDSEIAHRHVWGAVPEELHDSGKAYTRAHVALTGAQTGISLSTDSNEAGIYRFDAVDLGVYHLTVAHPGFRAYLGTGIIVEANRATTVDPRLEVDSAEISIEVRLL